MSTTLRRAAHRIPEQPTLTSFPKPTVLTNHHCPPFFTTLTTHFCPPPFSTIPINHFYPLTFSTIPINHFCPPTLPTLLIRHHSTLAHHSCPLLFLTILTHYSCTDGSKLMAASARDPCVNILMRQLSGFHAWRNSPAHTRSIVKLIS